MLHYCDDNFNEELPFAPQITLLMRALGLDLHYKVARVNLIDTLRAQFVLRRVHASIGRRRPRVNASWGDRTGHVVPAESLAAEPEDGPAVPAEILADEPEDPEDGLSTADMEEELGGDEGEISDYLSSPTYPF
ncbi:unnamed protein product [Linum trigynum]|uniref:Uncharacterized protein n=1 Tax=Linum trigynum TaxID=586398 RepID=A0AAV2EAB7_9ROSI